MTNYLHIRMLTQSCVLALLCYAFSNKIYAQGDSPCSATPLMVSSGTCVFTTGSTAGATYQSNAANGGNPACGFPGSADVWYSFVVPPSGAVAVTMEPGTIFDPALAVYSGTCNSLTLIECDDDSGLDMMPAVDRSDFNPGETLFIRLWNNNAPSGTYGICVTESHSDCGTAVVLCSNLAVTSNAYGGGSTEDGDWSGTNCIPGEYQSQWFKFQVQNAGTFSFILTPDAIAPGLYPDYDWALWKVTTTSPFCESFLPSTPAFSCNASSDMGPQGQTGIGPGGINASEPAGPGNAYCAPFPVVAGDVFYLWINNFTNSSSGFNFQFDPSMNLNCDFNDLLPVVTHDTSKVCPDACNGTINLNILNMAAPLNFVWSSNANGQTTQNIGNLCEGIYSVIITDNDGVLAYDTARIVSTPEIILSENHLNNTSCISGNGSINISASGGSLNYIYNWNSGATSNALANLSAGTYSVLVTDENNCSADTFATIIDDLVYPEILSISASDSVECASLCTNFNAVVNGAIDYRWIFGANDFSNSTNPNHCYSNPGNYSVQLIASNASSCSDTLSKINYIHINPNPQAYFAANKEEDLHVQFHDHSIGASSWNWQFGDINQSTSSLQNPDFIFPEYEEFCIQLAVQDSNECVDTTEQCITLYPKLGVFIPNAFSPNNDGLNDIFFIVGYPIVKCEFWIYNRWGEEVFHSNQIENGWNGKFPNSDITLPQDVYSYTVDITAVDKERQILSGLIQLLH